VRDGYKIEPARAKVLVQIEVRKMQRKMYFEELHDARKMRVPIVDSVETLLGQGPLYSDTSLSKMSQSLKETAGKSLDMDRMLRIWFELCRKATELKMRVC